MDSAPPTSPDPGPGSDVDAGFARDLLDRFARETGLLSDRPPRRYLWTDAYAVTTWLALHRRFPHGGHLSRALALVDQVHAVLGRHRPDDPRRGWISGLDEEKGADHPTAGGLRIGKPLAERAPDERQDPGLEWDRDGQYLHYLTRWMVALDELARAVPGGPFARWSIELARTALAAFRIPPGRPGAGGLYWKMSIALDRPLVPSSGHHDPLDGLAVFASLADPGPDPSSDHPLASEIATLAGLCRRRRWGTDDPLGIGGLLSATCRLARTRLEGGPAAALVPAGVIDRAASDAARSLGTVDAAALGRRPAERRLAFRELGLAIGLADVERLGRRLAEGTGDGVAGRSAGIAEARRIVRTLEPWLPLRTPILEFWRDPAHRRVGARSDHPDINAVMLAAASMPPD